MILKNMMINFFFFKKKKKGLLIKSYDETDLLNIII
jgi:hypothetical protein